MHELNCSAHVTHQTLQLSVAEINVSAVTSAGSSPPTTVSLISTGEKQFIYLLSFVGHRKSQQLYPYLYDRYVSSSALKSCILLFVCVSQVNQLLS